MRRDKQLFFNLLAEFCGAAIFMSVGCMADGPLENDNLGRAVAFGCSVVITYQCFQYSSGGHANPCVTCASIILGQTEVVEGILYMVLQLFGSFFGFFIAQMVKPDPFAFFDSKQRYCCNTLSNGVSIGGAFAIEFFCTVAYIFAWCSALDRRNMDKQDTMSLRLGLCLTCTTVSACIYAGGTANIYRPLPPAVFANYYDDVWIFVLAPIVPSIAIPFFWKYVLSETTVDEKTPGV